MRHHHLPLCLTCMLALALMHAASASGAFRFSSINSRLRSQTGGVPELLEGYVSYDEETGKFGFVKGLAGNARDDVPASGSFSDPLRHRSNFGQLRITTNAAYSDDVQMQAAGFLEGYLTAERIFDYAYNMKSWLASQTNDTFKVGDWLFAQDRWTREQVKAYKAAAAATTTAPAAAAATTATDKDADHIPSDYTTKSFGSRVASSSKKTTTAASLSVPSVTSSQPPPSDSYWPAVGLFLSQFDGLLAGYSTRLAEMGPNPPLERLTKWDFLVLNALGDMDDLLNVIFPDTDDGSDTSDYEDPSLSTTSTSNNNNNNNKGKNTSGGGRTPNPERDASFFFRPPTPAELQAAAAAADAADAGLPPAVPRRGSWDGLTPGQVRSRIAKTGRCSALVKVTPGLDDILLGHVTWWTYSSMLRIYKHYDFKLQGGSGMAMAGGDQQEGQQEREQGGPMLLRNLAGRPVNGRMSFSSYPGQVSSADDWYLLGGGLVVTETSLDTYDHNLYNASYGCTTSSLLSWQRVMTANLLAVDGPSWAEVAAAYNGGTYNNQYMVVNLNLFVPGSELQPGLLTITEIIPGMAVTADATADLERGHWPSYNVPYFPEVYDTLGYRRHAEAMANKGPEFADAVAGLSYQLAPRAKIFRRDAAGANDLASFRKLLRSNGFGRRPVDPLSAASPWDALCGRGDLDSEDPDAYGCYDGKVTNYWRALELSSDVINGPTAEDGQAPFRWDSHERFRRVPHRGMLEVYDTEWEEVRP